MRWVERVVRLLACSTATHTSARSRLRHRHPSLSLQQPAGISHKGFLIEANRRLNRAAKKLHKAEQKLADCESKQDKLLTQKSPSLEQLEALPPCNTLKIAVDVQIAERDLLSSLVDDLAATSWDVNSADELVPEALELIRRCESLNVRDSPPVRPPPKPRKPKGPLPNQVSPRLPYKAFEGSGGVEIRVGRTAKDNDVLSCDPDYRDADDWWLHAAGCPGSHVIVRSSSLPTPDDLPEEVIMDAAVLAANNSRAVLGGRIGVTLCRARQVSKPQGAKPGLVQLRGDVRTVKVDWKKEKPRLERLQNSLWK